MPMIFMEKEQKSLKSVIIFLSKANLKRCCADIEMRSAPLKRSRAVPMYIPESGGICKRCGCFSVPLICLKSSVIYNVGARIGALQYKEIEVEVIFFMIRRRVDFDYRDWAEFGFSRWVKSGCLTNAFLL